MELLGASVVAMPVTANRTEIEGERGITHLDCLPSVSQVSVQLGDGEAEVTEVLRLLEAAKLNVRLVKIHSGTMDFVVNGVVEPSRIQRIVGRPAKVLSNCAIVMLQSPVMRMMHGIMADALRALYAKGIEVHSTCDSYLSLSIVIPASQMKVAMSTLAKQFGVKGQKGQRT